jgi:N-acetylmuramoyl-L-alanine amidase
LRKFIATILLCCFFFSISSSAVEAKTVKYGYIQYVEKEIGPYFSLTVNGNSVQSGVLPVIDGSCLTVPLRPVIEGLGGTISWDGQTASATALLDGNTLVFTMNRSTCIVNNQTRDLGYNVTTIDGVTVVPLDILFDVFDINVSVDSEKRTVSINRSSYAKDVEGIKGMKFWSYDTEFDLRVMMDRDYKTDVFRVAAADNLPERIAVRIYGANKKDGQQTIAVNGRSVQNVRYTRFDKDIVGMALDLSGSPDFEYVMANNRLQITVGKKAQPPKEGTDSTVGEKAESGNTESPVQEGIVQKKMTYKKTDERTSALFLEGIVLQNGTYDLWKAADGKKFVLEIKKSAGVPEEQFFNLKDGTINTVSSRYNRIMEYTRITVETPVTCDIEIVPVLSGNVGTNLVFKAQPTASGPWVNKNKKNIITRGNVTYHSVGDRTAILLNGVQLTEGSKTLTRYYTSASLNGGKTLQITFPSKYGSLSTGTISVYDGTVNEIILEKDSRTGNNIITIHMAEPMVHTVIYRYDVNNTAITLVKQAKKEDRLVVIDPGHGGKEVGAVYNGVYEKNLNLDIALTVQEILESRGINTYIIREDDSYVGLYERAYIANALNASWFVSIHNNALENNSSVNGSMVFYHSASTQGKALASVILNRLTKDLGMPDRGIRVQNEYIVLQGTAMPSALVEVAFMSGDIDFTLLCTAQFRAKAAEAIANGIMDFIGR